MSSQDKIYIPSPWKTKMTPLASTRTPALGALLVLSICSVIEQMNKYFLEKL